MSNRKLMDLNDLLNLSQKNIEHMEKSENISLQKKLTPNLPKVRVNVDYISFKKKCPLHRKVFREYQFLYLIDELK